MEARVCSLGEGIDFSPECHLQSFITRGDGERWTCVAHLLFHLFGDSVLALGGLSQETGNE